MRSTFHVFDSQLNAGRLTQKESTQANRWQELAERLSSKVDQLREISLSASAVRCWGARVSPETVHTSPNSAKPEPLSCIGAKAEASPRRPGSLRSKLTT